MAENCKKPKHGIEITTPFHHTIPVQLRFNDIDILGHLNNSVYFSLFDLGKTRYFEAVRGGSIDWLTADIVIANINCDFVSQTFYDEPLEVRTQTLKMGEKSILLAQQVYNTATGEVKVQCTCVMVSFDVETGKSKPLSEQWRTALQTFEQRHLG
ncbi:MAG: acyl-CoA thioesterase [Muribaculaceae bacterium]